MSLPIEMYQKYIERRKLDRDQLLQAVDDRSVEVFKRIGHQIRGNAGSFGFEDLVNLGNRMESVDGDNLTSEGRAIIDALNAWVQVKEKEFTG